MSGDAFLVPIPPATKRALDDFAAGRLPFHALGSFVQAVLSNNLKEAFLRGDRENTKAMGSIVAYCYNHIPARAWGSLEAAAAWYGPEGQPEQSELLPVDPPVRRDALREG